MSVAKQNRLAMILGISFFAAAVLLKSCLRIRRDVTRQYDRIGPMPSARILHALSCGFDSVVTSLKLPAKDRGEDDSEKTTAPLTITLGRVGEVAFVGLGAEVFNEIGREIKSKSPFPHTIVITHCNGAAGYLVVPEAYAEGGYEVRTSPFAPEAAGQTLSEVMDGLHALRRGP